MNNLKIDIQEISRVRGSDKIPYETEEIELINKNYTEWLSDQFTSTYFPRLEVS